ncbi:MAG: pantetheine-phosphate adenylyltransferase [Caldisericia bacterium]|nr:pantetheine-phosphate adenylyltransferase [Caldisericia bacterium]MDD4613996.1 pantetheine-phosphate adenylyltransferase [Caldisericia bacterium]
MVEPSLPSFEECSNEKAVYPGSFDPLTYGHLDIIKRSLHYFQNLVVLIAENRKKTPFLSIEERVGLLQKYFHNDSRIHVEVWKGLLVDYMKQKDIPVCIRGLRVLSDFENEFQMAITNKQIYPDFEVLFFMSNMQHANLSSSMVKEMIHFQGNIRLFVPDIVAEHLEKRR